MPSEHPAIPTEDLDTIRLHLGKFFDIKRVHHATEFRKQLEERRGRTTFQCKTCGTAFNREFREIGIYQQGKDTAYMLTTECPHCKAKLVATIKGIEDLI